MKKTLLSRVLGSAIFVVLLAASWPAAAEQKALAVGQEAPGFVLPSSEGGSFELSSQRGEKKILLVFFRGTW